MLGNITGLLSVEKAKLRLGKGKEKQREKNKEIKKVANLKT